MSTLFVSILNSSLVLGNYLQQTTSADDILAAFFFLGTLRVKSPCWCISGLCVDVYVLSESSYTSIFFFMRAAKVLASMHICTGSSVASLFDSTI